MPARIDVGPARMNGPLLYRVEEDAPTPSATNGICARYGMILEKIMLPDQAERRNSVRAQQLGNDGTRLIGDGGKPRDRRTQIAIP
jgi:hypothetical protein